MNRLTSMEAPERRDTALLAAYGASISPDARILSRNLHVILRRIRDDDDDPLAEPPGREALVVRERPAIPPASGGRFRQVSGGRLAAGVGLLVAAGLSLWIFLW